MTEERWNAVGDEDVMAAAICSRRQEARGGRVMKVGAALDMVESGRDVGAFYRATEGRGGAGMRRGMAAIGGTSKLWF
jgi:hypothetical protein